MARSEYRLTNMMLSIARMVASQHQINVAFIQAPKANFQRNRQRLAGVVLTPVRRWPIYLFDSAILNQFAYRIAIGAVELSAGVVLLLALGLC